MSADDLAATDFCSRYQPVIKQRGDGSIQARLAVKQRIAANEVIYKCQCLKVQEPYCIVTKD